MTVKEMKTRGREAFKANYWRCVAAAFLLSLLAGGTAASGASSASSAGNAPQSSDGQAFADALQTNPDAVFLILGVIAAVLAIVMVVSLLLKIFLFNPLKVGCCRFFVKNVDAPPAYLDVIKEGFGGYAHTMFTLFLTDLFIALWSILFLIPGIVKSYSYRLVPYLIKDNPELSAMEAITRSRELMDGNKMRAFLLDLSFIGWYLLGILTFGLVQVFWTAPYHENAKAVFYLDVWR